MDLKAQKPRQPERREYTLMLVPHHGQAVSSIRIPIRYLKYGAGLLCVMVVWVIGVLINYQHTVKTAQTEKAELERLRQVNSTQVQQIEQLAQATAVLQQDVNRISQLEAEVRRLINTNESADTSRSGVVRPQAARNGQGGPAVNPRVEDLLTLVTELEETVKVREHNLTELRDVLVERNARIAATPSIWPASGEVTSRFGWRNSPWGWGRDWHPGIDIANDNGTPIVAAADGEVIYSGWYGGYGKMLQIAHGNGIVTVYAHNSQNLVDVGKFVKKGEIIAYMGSTGVSTGPHVHYEVRVNGTAVNPANFL